jgi:ATP-binding cassette subfamily F protein 3
LLLDEPTNHLDIATRQALASSLLEFEGALVMVSHDRHLLESITDRFWRVHQGAVTEFDGDLDDYAELLRKETNAENRSNKQSAPAAKTTHAAPAAAPIDRNGLSQRLKQLNNLVKKLEKQIETEKPKLSKLDDTLANCDYSNPDEAKKAAEQHQERGKIAMALEKAENDLLEAMVEIESLEETLGA